MPLHHSRVLTSAASPLTQASVASKSGKAPKIQAPVAIIVAHLRILHLADSTLKMMVSAIRSVSATLRAHIGAGMGAATGAATGAGAGEAKVAETKKAMYMGVKRMVVVGSERLWV
jgi:hypothetical protein